LHLQPAFSALEKGIGSYPVAEAAAARVVSLPMYPDLDAQRQDIVINAVRKALER